MQKRLAKQWHNALMGGKYQKCKGRLRKKDSKAYRYDIFGVLMDVLGEKFPEKVAPDYNKFNHRYKGQLAIYGYDFPPLSFLKRVGISTGQASLLIGMNDAGYSFEDLADVVIRLGD